MISGFVSILTRIRTHTIHNDVIKWKHFQRYWTLCEGNPPVNGGFPAQRPVTRSLDVFFKSAPEQTAEQAIETPMVWDAIVLIMTSL